MLSITKLLTSVSPLIVAALAQLGIYVTAAAIDVWINIVIWVIAAATTFSPSFRAWLNFREDAI